MQINSYKDLMVIYGKKWTKKDIEKITGNKVIKKNKTYYANILELKKDGMKLKIMPSEYKKDFNIVKIAIEQNPLAIQYAYEEIRDNKEVLETLLEKNSRVFLFASSRLKDDRDFVLKALKKDGMLIEYVSQRLKEEFNVMKSAIVNSDKGNAVCFTNYRQRCDKDLMDIAIKKNIKNIKYVSSEILNKYNSLEEKEIDENEI